MPRARAFDEDAALDAAIELFWVRGYRAASVSELSTATGVANGSLYQAWGSKWELFLAAFRRYCARRLELVRSAVDGRTGDVRATATGFLDAIVADCDSHPDRRGCLMINTMSELGSSAEVAQISNETVSHMDRAVADGLARASGLQARHPEVVSSAAHLVAVSQAVIQFSRIGRDEAEIRAVTGHAATMVARSLDAAA
ncbi:TetR/AcrR family transcriptional regulator [Microbacterium thalli]|uniref:TetR/AcrR family transcriptional regulator n=1 Tax=Microbacterium thalli TaxID=3027921 RepID=UPI002365FA51|nr:TetR/AcrR family transcriptional regulator [Microbacterium thalli]MDD7928196.1 TetR/AcrR family transcriptional regulator [Microbacterium thalli]